MTHYPTPLCIPTPTHLPGALVLQHGSAPPTQCLSPTAPLCPSPQDNLNLLLTEEEMYSLMETLQHCKIIPGEGLPMVGPIGWGRWLEEVTGEVGSPSPGTSWPICPPQRLA